MSKFTCQICCGEKEARLEMPESSLGCNCGKKICVQCFLHDFEVRKVAIWMNEHGMSQWEDETTLTMFLATEFQRENELETPEEVFVHPAFVEFFEANYHVGKRCPFCNKTCVWKVNKVPQVLPSTGRLTFFSPCYVQPLPMPNSMPNGF